jgi:hypothetical protein
MFTRVQGKTKFMWLPVTVSTAFSKGALVAFSSGYLIPATSSTAPSTHIGVIRHAIASTDADYAVARLVEVEVPVELNVVWEAAVTSGLVAADVGLFQDLTDSVTVNRAASTYDAVQCVKVISTTLGHFIINAGVAGMGVVGG